jgi:serine/threonine protein kinase
MQLPKDIPISSFKPLRVLKQGADCRVDLVQHLESGKQYVLKTYDREKVMQNGQRIDQVLNEANILKVIAGIP